MRGRFEPEKHDEDEDAFGLDGRGQPGSRADELRGRPLLLIILLAGGVAALIIALSGDKSPG